MCEILAVAAKEKISFDSILPWASELERLGVAGFGWGVAWLDAARVCRYRDSGRLADDADGVAGLASVRSSRFLVHLRRPSRLSTLATADTQPFLDSVDEERGEGRVAFCHNGYLERHAELRPRFRGRLRGRADSEVGFQLLLDRLAAGDDPAGALSAVHERLGGAANLGLLDAGDGLLVYSSHPENPFWRFDVGGMAVAATGLHSDDDSLFELLFEDATGRRRIGRDVVRVEPADAAAAPDRMRSPTAEIARR